MSCLDNPCLILKSSNPITCSTVIPTTGFRLPARNISAASDTAFISSLGNYLVAKVESCADALI